MLGVEDERGVHGAHAFGRGSPAVQQMQEMPADRVVVGLDLDAPAIVAVVIPVEQHRAEPGHEAIGDVPGVGHIVVVLLRQYRAEHRDAGAHHVHRVRRGRHAFERGLDGGRQAAQRAQLRLVGCELGGGRQLAVHEQIGDFLEFGLVGEIEDVVAAVVQVVAGAPDGAQRGIAGGDAGQGDGFLRFGAEASTGFVAASVISLSPWRIARPASSRTSGSPGNRRGRSGSASGRRRSSACLPCGWRRTP